MPNTWRKSWQLIHERAGSIIYTVNQFDCDLDLNNYCMSLTHKVLTENFANNELNWFTVDDQECYINFENGKYIFHHKSESGNYATWISLPLTEGKAFSIETAISFLGGYEKNGFGLMWGHKTALTSDSKSYSYYYFVISASGKYVIRSYDQETGDVNVIQPWTDSAFINIGENSTNILKIVRFDEEVDKNFYFTINNQIVFSCISLPFFGFELGFIVFQNIKIGIDFFKVNYHEAENAIISNSDPQIPEYTSNSNNPTFKGSFYELVDYLGLPVSQLVKLLGSPDEIESDKHRDYYYFSELKTSFGIIYGNVINVIVPLSDAYGTPFLKYATECFIDGVHLDMGPLQVLENWGKPDETYDLAWVFYNKGGTNSAGLRYSVLLRFTNENSQDGEARVCGFEAFLLE